MKDASLDTMFVDGGKGDIHNEAGEHHGAGCRLRVEFLIEKRETRRLGVMMLLTSGCHRQQFSHHGKGLIPLGFVGFY